MAGQCQTKGPSTILFLQRQHKILNSTQYTVHWRSSKRVVFQDKWRKELVRTFLETFIISLDPPRWHFETRCRHFWSCRWTRSQSDVWDVQVQFYFTSYSIDIRLYQVGSTSPTTTCLWTDKCEKLVRHSSSIIVDVLFNWSLVIIVKQVRHLQPVMENREFSECQSAISYQRENDIICMNLYVL